METHRWEDEEEGEQAGWGAGGGVCARVLPTTADTLIKVHSREMGQKQLLCIVI